MPPPLVLPATVSMGLVKTMLFPLNVNDAEPLVKMMLAKGVFGEKLFVVKTCEPLPKESPSPACGEMLPQFAAVSQLPSGAPPLVQEMTFNAPGSADEAVSTRLNCWLAAPVNDC